MTKAELCRKLFEEGQLGLDLTPGNPISFLAENELHRLYEKYEPGTQDEELIVRS